MLLSQDFLKLLMLTSLAALPMACYMMRQWLQNFAYKTVLEWYMFGASVFIVISIALLTVSVQTVKAALVNPVKSLRTN